MFYDIPLPSPQLNLGRRLIVMSGGETSEGFDPRVPPRVERTPHKPTHPWALVILLICSPSLACGQDQERNVYPEALVFSVGENSACCLSAWVFGERCCSHIQQSRVRGKGQGLHVATEHTARATAVFPSSCVPLSPLPAFPYNLLAATTIAPGTCTSSRKTRTTSGSAAQSSATGRHSSSPWPRTKT